MFANDRMQPFVLSNTQPIFIFAINVALFSLNLRFPSDTHVWLFLIRNSYPDFLPEFHFSASYRQSLLMFDSIDVVSMEHKTSAN